MTMSVEKIAEAPVFVEHTPQRLCHLVDPESRTTVCKSISISGTLKALGDEANSESVATRTLANQQVPGVVEHVQSDMLASPCEKCFIEEGW